MEDNAFSLGTTVWNLTFLRSESIVQERLQGSQLEELAVHASCQRLKLAGLTSQQYLCMPELLRVVKLLGSSDSEASATEMLQIPVSLWQALVPQLLSLLVSNKVCLQPSELNEKLCVSQSKRSQPSLH